MSDVSAVGDQWSALLDELSQTWPPQRWIDVGVVVGCSGGADSVALLTALDAVRAQQSAAENEPRGFLIAAHFNHCLRGAASDDDESFVAELAKRRDITFRSERADGETSDEAGLREQRLEFLIETALAAGARYVALAHSADDNVETVLHHLMRGTGPAGIAGIPPARSLDADLVLVRPLLNTRRSRIRDALRQIDQPWREDLSNEDTRYRRNWIRHTLIPLVQTQYPDVVEAVQRAIEGQRSWRYELDQQAAKWLNRNVEREEPLCIRRNNDASSPVVVAALQRLWIQRGWPRGGMTRDHWLRLVATIQGVDRQRYMLPGAIEIDADEKLVAIDVQ